MDILTQVSRSYALVLKEQQQTKLTEYLVKLSDKFLNIVNERIKAGKVAALEKVKSEINFLISK
jgi:outer membrane protein TolC